MHLHYSKTPQAHDVPGEFFFYTMFRLIVALSSGCGNGNGTNRSQVTAITGPHLEMSIQVLIADSQIRVRRALRLLLEQQPGLALVGAAADAQALLALLKQCCPDLVLLDWELSGILANDLTVGLHSLRRPPAVVAFGECSETRNSALAAGAWV